MAELPSWTLNRLMDQSCPQTLNTCKCSLLEEWPGYFHRAAKRFTLINTYVSKKNKKQKSLKFYSLCINYNLNKTKISQKHSCILGLSWIPGYGKIMKLLGGLWFCWHFQTPHRYGVFPYCLLELNTWTWNKDVTWNLKSPLEAGLLGQVSGDCLRMTPDGFCCKNSLILCQYKLILRQQHWV